MYTVIAGVLNLLVIYDAFAGPMFRDPPKESEFEAEDDAKPSPPPTPEPQTGVPPVIQPGGTP